MEKINLENKNFLYVPFSLFEQRWFKSEAAVRAWFFYAWNSLFDEEKNIDGVMFHLKPGEMICTRSYLAKSLNISVNTAKGNTDKLNRNDAIYTKQERFKEKKTITKITVKGVPVPNEPYVKMTIPFRISLMWQLPGLAQLYIYLLCSSQHKAIYDIGVAGEAILLQRGEQIVSYNHLKEKLKCSEANLKKNLRILEQTGAITRKRVGNRGILINCNYYPQQKIEEKSHDSRPKNKQKKERKKLPVVNESPAIKQTPVTEAVKYLFFELKRNKNIGFLNEIIDFVNEKIPQGFPLEKLKEAMDLYYNEFGDKYIDKQKLMNVIIRCNQQNMQSQNKKITNEQKLAELNNRKQKIEQENSQFIEKWRVVGKAFKINYTEDSTLSALQPEEIKLIYYVLRTCNIKRNYVSQEKLRYSETSGRPATWTEETKIQADFVEKFFAEYKTYEEFCRVYRSEYQIFKQTMEQEIASIAEEEKIYQKAI